MDLDKDILSPKYKEAAATSLWVQIPLGVLSLLMLDGGHTAKVFAITLGGFWLCAILMALRRPFFPAWIGLWFWRWGFIPCFALSFIVAKYLGRV